MLLTPRDNKLCQEKVEATHIQKKKTEILNITLFIHLFKESAFKFYAKHFVIS